MSLLRIIRLNLSLIFLTLSQLTFAQAAYIGTQVGWGDVHQGDYLSKRFRELVDNVFTAEQLRDYTILFNNTGVAGRIFAGYQFTNAFALEMGYVRFSNLHIKTAFKAKVLSVQQMETQVWAKISLDARAQTYVIDLMAKLVYPFKEKMDVFAKIGLAYLETKSNINLEVQAEVLRLGLENNPSLNLIYPALALGVSYHFTRNVAADFSWEHIQRYNAKFFPNIDFVSVGLLYHFV